MERHFLSCFSSNGVVPSTKHRHRQRQTQTKQSENLQNVRVKEAEGAAQGSSQYPSFAEIPWLWTYIHCMHCSTARLINNQMSSEVNNKAVWGSCEGQMWQQISLWWLGSKCLGSELSSRAETSITHFSVRCLNVPSLNLPQSVSQTHGSYSHLHDCKVIAPHAREFMVKISLSTASHIFGVQSQVREKFTAQHHCLAHHSLLAQRCLPFYLSIYLSIYAELKTYPHWG